MSRIRLISTLFVTFFVSAPVLAETPNLQPGMWSHTTTTTVEGPMAMQPQSTTTEQCLTQEQVNKGVDMLEIPKQCQVNKVNVLRDKADFALTCNMQGMPMVFNGNTTFNGDHMAGKMSSEIDSPLGKMMMKMHFTAKRVGDCPQ